MRTHHYPYTHPDHPTQVARMLFIMACLFAVSWLPSHLLSIMFHLLDKEQLVSNGDVLSDLHAYALWLGHANSAINPICYYAMSRRFRVSGGWWGGGARGSIFVILLYIYGPNLELIRIDNFASHTINL